MIDITQKVIDIITHELRIKPGLVLVTSNLKDDLGVASLDALEIIVALEDAFKIVLPDDTHENIITVQDVIDNVSKYIKR